MAVREIVLMGDPVLREEALEVTNFNRDLRSLVRDLYESMYHAEGVGLAAPQIGISKRVIVIDHGRILFDGQLATLSQRVAPFKMITIDLHRNVDGYDFSRVGEVLESEDRKVKLRVAKDATADVTSRLLADLPVLDLTIEDPPI